MTRRTGQNRPHPPHAISGELVTSLGLTGFETAVLTQARCFFVDQSGHWPPYLQGPARFAETLFDTRDPEMLASTVFNFICTVASARIGQFSFSSPFCAACAATVTPDERNLMLLLHELGQNRPSKAMVHAMLLCETGPVVRLLHAGRLVMALEDKTPAKPRSMVFR